MSGRLGIATGWDIGATIFLGFPNVAGGIDIKRMLARDSGYASAVSVGVNYLRSVYVKEGGFLNLPWSGGTKQLTIQVQSRLLAGDQIPIRYGLNGAIALRPPEREKMTTYFGLNCGFLTGKYHKTEDQFYAGSTLGWVAFILQINR